MEAHAADFRSEGGDDDTTQWLKLDYRKAKLTKRERALCDYAVKLTEDPGNIARDDLKPLREAGLSDKDIHDAVQVIAYFNYINRIADALGTDLEPEMAPRPETTK
jgi:uncharacterized peroxidase-related enzyme